MSLSFLVQEVKEDGTSGRQAGAWAMRSERDSLSRSTTEESLSGESSERLLLDRLLQERLPRVLPFRVACHGSSGSRIALARERLLREGLL